MRLVKLLLIWGKWKIEKQENHVHSLYLGPPRSHASPFGEWGMKFHTTYMWSALLYSRWRESNPSPAAVSDIHPLKKTIHCSMGGQQSVRVNKTPELPLQNLSRTKNKIPEILKAPLHLAAFPPLWGLYLNGLLSLFSPYLCNEGNNSWLQSNTWSHRELYFHSWWKSRISFINTV